MTAPLPLLTEDEVHAVIRDDVDERRSFGCLSSDRGQLPLKALDVDARVIGTFAHTTVTQTFNNTAGVPVEATYIFPLPDRAAVTRFTMVVAGRRVEGDLQERGAARRTYDAAITAGKRASIAEEERPGTFTLRVGNLLPNEDATIIIELTGPLSVVDGEVTYRFPLVVAPRYMPGTPLRGEQVGDGQHLDTSAVPDASRISPPVLLAGYPNPVRLGIRVRLDPAGLPLSQVRSALHAAWADDDEGLLQVKIGAGERLNRDFILRFTLGDGAMRTSARAADSKGDDAFLLTVLPAMLSTTKRPRDLVFVVDRSGSMSGWKMIAARRSVARMIDTLRGADRFCVMAFDDRVEYADDLGNRLVPATDRARFTAVEWLATVNDRGGTEMAQPLAEAADLLAGGDLERDRVLVFVTDGQVGNEAQILKLLGTRLKKTRVFALGIDQAVNAGFMNRLASLGASGEAELVESEDRVDDVLARCHRRIDAPALSELTISIEDAELVSDTIAPSRLPDVFDGVPAVIVGKLRRRHGKQPTLIVRGKDASGATQTLRVAVETSGNPSLLPAWARLHLRDLEDRFDGHQGDRGTLQASILRVSLEAKVLCRFTAFVAVDHEVVNAGGRVHKTTQAVEQPAGWADAGIPMEASALWPAPVSPVRSQGFASAAPVLNKSTASFDADSHEDSDEVTGAGIAMPTASPARDSSDDEAPAAVGRSSVRHELQAPTVSKDRADSLVDRARRAVFGDAKSKQAAPPPPAMQPIPPKGALSARAEPAPAKREASAGLEAWFPRLTALLARLDSEGLAALEDVAAELRVIVEEMAHAGVSPVARKPILTALEALLRRDLATAASTLRAVVPRRVEGFWGA